MRAGMLTVPHYVLELKQMVCEYLESWLKYKYRLQMLKFLSKVFEYPLFATYEHYGCRVKKIFGKYLLNKGLQ